MKNILVGLCVLSTFSAFAGVFGLPEEDAVVKNVRQRFESGKSPQDSDLINKSYKCKNLVATKGDFAKETLSNNLKFSAFDGLYELDFKGTVVDKVLFVDTGTELIGNSSSGNALSLRVDDKKNIIGEWISTYDSSKSISPITTGFDTKYKVISYLLCVQN